MFEPVAKARAFETVVEQIETAIVQGVLRPGDHLPPERTLVEEFQVSRSTVREALRILESIGLLKTEPGSPRGPRVSPSSTRGLQRMLGGVLRIEQIGLADLVQYRMISGSAANFLAAHLRTDEHLQQMAVAIKVMESASTDDPEAFARADMEFHEAVTQAAGNNFMTKVGTVINQVIVDVVAETIEVANNSGSMRQEFIAVHRRILQAIEERDADAAAAQARTSLYDVYAPLLSEPDQERLRLLL